MTTETGKHSYVEFVAGTDIQHSLAHRGTLIKGLNCAEK